MEDEWMATRKDKKTGLVWKKMLISASKSRQDTTTGTAPDNACFLSIPPLYIFLFVCLKDHYPHGTFAYHIIMRVRDHLLCVNLIIKFYSKVIILGSWFDTWVFIFLGKLIYKNFFSWIHTLPYFFHSQPDLMFTTYYHYQYC